MMIYLKCRCHQIHMQDQHIHRERIPLNITWYRKSVASAIWEQSTLFACYLPFRITFALSGITGQLYTRTPSISLALNITMSGPRCIKFSSQSISVLLENLGCTAISEMYDQAVLLPVLWLNTSITLQGKSSNLQTEPKKTQLAIVQRKQKHRSSWTTGYGENSLWTTGVGNRHMPRLLSCDVQSY